MEHRIKVLVCVVIFVSIILMILFVEAGKDKPFIICSDSKKNVELHVKDYLLTQEHYDEIIKSAVRKHQNRHGIAGMIPY